MENSCTQLRKDSDVTGRKKLGRTRNFRFKVCIGHVLMCAQMCASHAVFAHNVRRTRTPAHPMLPSRVGTERQMTCTVTAYHGHGDSHYYHPIYTSLATCLYTSMGRQGLYASALQVPPGPSRPGLTPAELSLVRPGVAGGARVRCVARGREDTISEPPTGTEARGPPPRGSARRRR